MNAVRTRFAVIVGFTTMVHCNAGFAKPGEDFCNLAKVEKLAVGQSLVVYSKPGSKFRKVDALKSGAFVYICDSTEDWYEVFYGFGEEPCSAVVDEGLPFEKTRSCKSGWVSKKLISVISG
jgi:hypothetical protein